MCVCVNVLVNTTMIGQIHHRSSRTKRDPELCILVRNQNQNHRVDSKSNSMTDGWMSNPCSFLFLVCVCLLCVSCSTLWKMCFVFVGIGIGIGKKVFSSFKSKSIVCN